MVYVINKDGSPLMPCTETKAKHLLEAKKAKVIRRTPFTIKLLWDCENNTQEVVAGMDTGSKKIGCAVISNGKVVYQSEVQLRSDVSKKMERRKMYRRTRRSRKTRYRKPRWTNRASARRKDRLAPSTMSKVESHLREKKFVESVLPVTKWKVETASFDIQKIKNPGVSGKEYKEGAQKGFYNVKAYVLHRDGYQCQRQKCKAKNTKLQVHHVLFRSKGGTDTPDNLITLCKPCHKKLHAGEFSIKAKKSRTKHATEIGIIKSFIKKSFGDFKETFGYETKYKRECILKLPKMHYNDAVAICCEEGELVYPSSTVFLKRHVAKGDYQQTKGKHSEKRIPTGKLFGLRKFDLIETPKCKGFVKAKRRDGYFVVSDIFGKMVSNSASAKKECRRISARSTTLVSFAK